MVVSFSPLLRTGFVPTPGQHLALREAKNEALSLGNQLSLWETTTLLGIPRKPSEAVEDAECAFLPPCLEPRLDSAWEWAKKHLGH